MPHLWPADTEFADWELDVLERNCPHCGHLTYICDHRHRHVFTLDGPVHLICKLNHCPDPRCPGHSKTKSPEIEPTIALPGWAIAWDVFCWIGHRRFSRHWAIPQIRCEMLDRFAISLTEPGIAKYIGRYQTMLAARQQDPETLRQLYDGVDEIILSIDGLQPEKGHETLYVVRELSGKRVWFAEPLLSATAVEVRRLIAQAKQWAENLGQTVTLWVSDKQDAFVSGIAEEFPGVPHRYCGNHFLRDLAKPVLEADSHAKVQMRQKVRGLRSVEQSILEHRRPPAAEPVAASASGTSPTEATVGLDPLPVAEDPAGDVVLDYCAAIRGILNDDQGGPLDPPGLKMAGALDEVRQSIGRNLEAKKGGSRRCN